MGFIVLGKIGFLLTTDVGASVAAGYTDKHR